MEKKKVIAKIETISIDIDSPVKMSEFKMEINKISVLTGPNGVGKTMVMIFMYVLNSIARASWMKVNGSDLLNTANTILSKCFDDLKTNGTVRIDFNNNYFVETNLKNGVITSVNDNIIPNEISEFAQVVFMSKNMRTFDAIKSYLTIRKLHVNNEGDLYIIKMFDTYKMYDVMAIEQLINRMPIKIDNKTSQMLKEFDFEGGIKEVNIDLDKCDFYGVLEDGSKKYFTTYGAGHQSILNMFLMNMN